jgi:hypothetical protein
MRRAKVETETCTWCFVIDKKELPGPIPIPVTLAETESGGFTFFYDPASDQEDSKAFGCVKHASVVTEMLNKFKSDVLANIVGAVQAEENAITEGELPEGYEEPEHQGDDDDEEEEEEEEEEESPKGNAEALLQRMGEKVKPEVKHVPTPPELQERINAAGRVQNPKPGEADSNAVNPERPEEPEPWRAHFPEGYQPSSVPPKGEEKDACLAWFNGLPKKDKLALTKGRGSWPLRRMDTPLIQAWHRCPEKAAYLKTIEERATV